MVTYFDTIVAVLDTVYSHENDAEFRKIVHENIASEVDEILSDPFIVSNKYEAVFDVIVKNLGNGASTPLTVDAVLAKVGKADLIPRTSSH